MLKDGFELMIVGMGVVFAFLTLLVLCLTVASATQSAPLPGQFEGAGSCRGRSGPTDS